MTSRIPLSRAVTISALCAAFLAACGGPEPDPAASADPAAQRTACVDTVLCVQGTHWDSHACACVPDATTCVDTMMCIQGSHWDSKACRCVKNPPDGCTTAADCTGVLPSLCLTCSNGATGCAHWACVAGQCQTRYCNAK